MEGSSEAKRREYWKHVEGEKVWRYSQKKKLVCSVIRLDLHVTFLVKLMLSTLTWLRQFRQGVEQLAARFLSRYLNRNQTT